MSKYIEMREFVNHKTINAKHYDKEIPDQSVTHSVSCLKDL